MTIYKQYPNPVETYITRIDILEEGGNFRTGDKDHNAALILECENGHPYGVEYISVEEFANFMSSYTAFSTNEIFEVLGRYAEDFEEPSIDFSIIDGDMINHFEHFRASEYNHSGYISPFSTPFQK